MLPNWIYMFTYPKKQNKKKTLIKRVENVIIIIPVFGSHNKVCTLNMMGS